MRHRSLSLSPSLIFSFNITHPCLTLPWTPTLTASQMAHRHSKTSCAFPQLVLPLFIKCSSSLRTHYPPPLF
ncbi:hypothetical protein EDB84DRAFT_1507104 [Lactarius hengduanensis]|nr:hypothetical protein EDB84DRAFT_1507104 [Lactarius hengduanensis]